MIPKCPNINNVKVLCYEQDCDKPSAKCNNFNSCNVCKGHAGCVWEISSEVIQRKVNEKKQQHPIHKIYKQNDFPIKKMSQAERQINRIMEDFKIRDWGLPKSYLTDGNSIWLESKPSELAKIMDGRYVSFPDESLFIPPRFKQELNYTLEHVELLRKRSQDNFRIYNFLAYTDNHLKQLPNFKGDINQELTMIFDWVLERAIKKRFQLQVPFVEKDLEITKEEVSHFHYVMRFLLKETIKHVKVQLRNMNFKEAKPLIDLSFQLFEEKNQIFKLEKGQNPQLYSQLQGLRGEIEYELKNYAVSLAHFELSDKNPEILKKIKVCARKLQKMDLYYEALQLLYRNASHDVSLLDQYMAELKRRLKFQECLQVSAQIIESLEQKVKEKFQENDLDYLIRIIDEKQSLAGRRGERMKQYTLLQQLIEYSKKKNDFDLEMRSRMKLVRFQLHNYEKISSLPIIKEAIKRCHESFDSVREEKEKILKQEKEEEQEEQEQQKRKQREESEGMQEKEGGEKMVDQEEERQIEKRELRKEQRRKQKEANKKQETIVNRHFARFLTEKGKAIQNEQEALKCCQQAIKIYQQHFPHEKIFQPYYRQMEIKFKKQEWEEVIKSGDHSNKIYPSHACYLKIAIAHYRRYFRNKDVSEIKEAIINAELALNISENSLETLGLLGELYRTIDEFKKSNEYYFQFLNKSERNFKILSRIAHNREHIAKKIVDEEERKKQIEAAFELYSEALEMKSDHAESILGLGRVLIELGNDDAAEKKLMMIIEKEGPVKAEACMYVGNIIERRAKKVIGGEAFFDDNKLREALKMYKQAGRIPKNKQNQERVHELLEEFMEAEKVRKQRWE